MICLIGAIRISCNNNESDATDYYHATLYPGSSICSGQYLKVDWSTTVSASQRSKADQIAIFSDHGPMSLAPWLRCELEYPATNGTCLFAKVDLAQGQYALRFVLGGDYFKLGNTRYTLDIQAPPDQCGVCGGNNATCAGCDGKPNSGLTRDSCGVCGGNDNSCLMQWTVSTPHVVCTGVVFSLAWAAPSNMSLDANIRLILTTNSLLWPVPAMPVTSANGSINIAIPAEEAGEYYIQVCNNHDVPCTSSARISQDPPPIRAVDCFGCDGVRNSNLTLDSCGNCNGKDETCNDEILLTCANSTCPLQDGSIVWHAPSNHSALDCVAVKNPNGSVEYFPIESGQADGTIAVPWVRGIFDVEYLIECGPQKAIQHSVLSMIGYVDACGQCNGLNQSCSGCDGILHSNLTFDDCGVCNGDGGCSVPYAVEVPQHSCINTPMTFKWFAPRNHTSFSIFFAWTKYDAAITMQCKISNQTTTLGSGQGDCSFPPSPGNMCRCELGPYQRFEGTERVLLQIEPHTPPQYLGEILFSNKIDACGVCGGDGKSCLGCDGVPASNKIYDICGVCGGNNQSCLGCDGVPGSQAVPDACGVCGGNNRSCVGCDGVPNSQMRYDACRVCGGDNTTCSNPNTSTTTTLKLVVSSVQICEGESVWISWQSHSAIQKALLYWNNKEISQINVSIDTFHPNSGIIVFYSTTCSDCDDNSRHPNTTTIRLIEGSGNYTLTLSSSDNLTQAAIFRVVPSSDCSLCVNCQSASSESILPQTHIIIILAAAAVVATVVVALFAIRRMRRNNAFQRMDDQHIPVPKNSQPSDEELGNNHHEAPDIGGTIVDQPLYAGGSPTARSPKPAIATAIQHINPSPKIVRKIEKGLLELQSLGFSDHKQMREALLVTGGDVEASATALRSQE